MNEIDRDTVSPDKVSSDAVTDDRGPSWGLGRLVMALFWIFGIVTTAVAVRDLIREPETPIGLLLISLIAGLIYLVVAIGITHNGRKMRMIAWVGVITEMIGPLITGLLELGLPVDPSAARSAWSQFGADYWYLPLLIPAIGIIWMWRSDPRRIVELAEGIERPSRYGS